MKIDKKPIWRRFSEFLFLLLALVVWLLAVPFVRIIDPTAAVFDAGVFMAFVYGIAGVFLTIQVVWFLLWFRFKGVYHFLDKHFSRTFKNDLTSWEKLKLSLSLFFAFLFAQVLLVMAVL